MKEREHPWRPMAEAKEINGPVLTLMRSDLETVRGDLDRWSGRYIVVQWEGNFLLNAVREDFGWSVAAPVGHGGLPDEWFVGWTHVPGWRQQTCVACVHLKEGVCKGPCWHEGHSREGEAPACGAFRKLRSAG